MVVQKTLTFWRVRGYFYCRMSHRDRRSGCSWLNINVTAAAQVTVPSNCIPSGETAPLLAWLDLTRKAFTSGCSHCKGSAFPHRIIRRVAVLDCATLLMTTLPSPSCFSKHRLLSECIIILGFAKWWFSSPPISIFTHWYCPVKKTSLCPLLLVSF